MPPLQTRSIFLALALTIANTANAQTFNASQFTKIDYPGVNTTSLSNNTQPFGINDEGTIVGNATLTSTTYGVFEFAAGKYRAPKFSSLCDVVNLTPRASAISGSGVIVGNCWTKDDSQYIGFVWNQGVIDELKGPGGSATIPQGINTTGEIVGLYEQPPAGSGVYLPFLRLSSGKFLTNIFPSISSNSYHSLSISDAGQIADSIETSTATATQYSFALLTANKNGIYQTKSLPLPPFANLIGPTITGINDKGEIVGYYSNYDYFGYGHGFVYSNGTYTSFDVPFANYVNTTPSGINNEGEIVGWYQDPFYKTYHGFLLQP